MIQPMAARLRSTGRKSSNFRDGAFVAGAANADGITIAVINTALKAVPPPSRNGAEGCRKPLLFSRAIGPEDREFADSLLEGAGFELVWGRERRAWRGHMAVTPYRSPTYHHRRKCTDREWAVTAML
jgi:hypothetical protein